jgi:uncharacterized protein YndB with AHSA1/START domain
MSRRTDQNHRPVLLSALRTPPLSARPGVAGDTGPGGRNLHAAILMTVTGQPAVRRERTIPASPAQVYRAWLDPGLLVRWMAPGSYAVTRAEVDERVGGHFRIWHADPSGTAAGGFDGELAELVPDQRIVFRWGFVGPRRRDGATFDSLLTVTLREAPDGGTVLTLVHERLDDLAAALPGLARNTGPGWEDVLGKLADAVGGGRAIADLGEPGALELLERQPLARLGYTGPDGYPRVIPIGFLWRGGRIIVCTATIAPKVAALSARPHVALTIDNDNAAASKALCVRGVATIDIVDGVPEEYLAAAAKGIPADQNGQFEAQVRSAYKQMARISVEPRWARYYDYTAGRVPEFLHKL